jgi:hypothetical protein
MRLNLELEEAQNLLTDNYRQEAKVKYGDGKIGQRAQLHETDPQLQSIKEQQLRDLQKTAKVRVNRREILSSTE